MLRMQREKTCPLAVPPQRKTPGAAGYDLYALGDHILPARGRGVFPTGWKIDMPPGVYGRMAPRSGLALKGIDVGAGVIDADYRGAISVILFNHSDEPFVIKPGQAIAQLILEQHLIVPTEIVADDYEFVATGRGARGFGSTDGVDGNKPFCTKLPAPGDLLVETAELGLPRPGKEEKKEQCQENEKNQSQTKKAMEKEKEMETEKQTLTKKTLEKIARDMEECVRGQRLSGTLS